MAAESPAMADNFVHLHLHTEYSKLDGECRIPALIRRVSELGMPAVAITDHGVMHGIYTFLSEARKYNGGGIEAHREKIGERIGKLEGRSGLSSAERAELEHLRGASERLCPVKPIVGVEAYMSPSTRHSRDKSEKPWHLVLLAKNEKGYENLCHLSYYSNAEGFYGKPRVDFELLERYKEGLIVSSACLAGPIARSIGQNRIELARENIRRFKAIFGDDFYLEYMLHPPYPGVRKSNTFDRQARVAAVQLMLAHELGVAPLVTNDVHFLLEAEADYHDMLLCISFDQLMSDPDRIVYTHQEFLKSPAQMYETLVSSFSTVSEFYRREYPSVRGGADLMHASAFVGLPGELTDAAWESLVREGMANTVRIAESVEEYALERKPLMPDFPLPEGFTDEAAYLRHRVYEGAVKRWGAPIPETHKERIDYELDVVIGMGFPGYFLIVADIQDYARSQGIPIGPGRGSAPGAAISYCLEITNLDPLEYDLLFERFLNPDRVSLPDIDLDFHDGRREEIVRYVQRKYGEDCVAGVSTFNRNQLKGSFNDAVRVLELKDNPEIGELRRHLNSTKTTSFSKFLKECPEVEKAYNEGSALVQDFLRRVEYLSDRLRAFGQHACAYIISPGPVHNFVPMCMPPKSGRRASADGQTAIEMQFMVQYEGKDMESIGLIKMDFLGLKTLRVLDLTLKEIERRHDVQIDLDSIPLDDSATYELFAHGETVTLFQFESAGMIKYMRQLKPTRFSDLIAMNALYRPGPILFVDSFIRRKHGQERIEYVFEEQAQVLDETYGVTVFQEQVMRQSRLLAGFTAGDADSLRKAIGKKRIAEMERLEGKFKEGCRERGHDAKAVNDLWAGWLSFASYAFNKSHSTAYAYVAYQTAYLKVHYPCEYLAACLEVALGKQSEQQIALAETQRMGINLLPPDVNESNISYTVTGDREMRCAFSAIKGLGYGAVDAIVSERERGGRYEDIYDFVQRVDAKVLSISVMELLIRSGSLDRFIPKGLSRSSFFAPPAHGGGASKGEGQEKSFLESLLEWAYAVSGGGGGSLFSREEIRGSVPKPEWPLPGPGVAALRRAELEEEKELLGFYLSSHPLDEYRLELEHFCTVPLEKLKNDVNSFLGSRICVGGMVTDVEVRDGKNQSGREYRLLRVRIEDFTDSEEFTLFNEAIDRLGGELQVGNAVALSVRIQPGRDGYGPSRYVDNVVPLRAVQSRGLLRLSLLVDADRFTAASFELLKELLAPLQGPCPVSVELTGQNGKRTHEIRTGRGVGVKLSVELIDQLLENGVPFKINGRLIEQKSREGVLSESIAEAADEFVYEYDYEAEYDGND